MLSDGIPNHIYLPTPEIAQTSPPSLLFCIFYQHLQLPINTIPNCLPLLPVFHGFLHLFSTFPPGLIVALLTSPKLHPPFSIQFLLWILSMFPHPSVRNSTENTQHPPRSSECLKSSRLHNNRAGGSERRKERRSPSPSLHHPALSQHLLNLRMKLIKPQDPK